MSETNGHCGEHSHYALEYEPVTLDDLLQPLPLAVQAVLRVLNGPGAQKHGDAWKSRPDHIDMDAMQRHLLKHESSDFLDTDHETGELHLAHAAARLLIRLERRLRTDKSRLIAKKGEHGDPA